MRTIHFRTLSMGALALLTFAGGIAAQTSSSAVLNSLEVQDLIKRAEPADHARLGTHFAALSEQYAADAKKHTAMAQAFMSGPSRRFADLSGANHCKRLAERITGRFTSTSGRRQSAIRPTRMTTPRWRKPIEERESLTQLRIAIAS